MLQFIASSIICTMFCIFSNIHKNRIIKIWTTSDKKLHC